MTEKIIFKNIDIKLSDCNYEMYKICTYDCGGKLDGKVILSEKDIERAYYAMKLNMLNKY